MQVHDPRRCPPSPCRSRRACPSGLVICATCSPMKATSSMSAVPSEYQGSSTQSCPQPTGMPRRAHLLHPRQAAALGEGVVPALQHDVDQRVRDRRHPGLGDQRQELRDVVVVHRVHRGQVRARRSARRARAAGSRGPASRCAATAGRRSRRSAGRASARARRRCSARTRTDARALLHRALEVRDAADDVDAHVERAQRGSRGRSARG